MTTETSNARGEWVLVPREPSAGMLDSAENAMIESEWAYNAGKHDARSDAHGFPTMRIWQAVVAYRAMLAAAPQPPAEAQAVAKLVNRKDSDGGKTTTFIRPTSLGMDLPLGEYPLHLHPPPSAPVGVDAPGSRAWMAEVCRAAALSLAAHGVRNDQLSKVADWIAQQPAAVDEAYPTPRNRTEALALAKLALAYLGVIDAHIDAAIARCETDLATKRQEPTT